MRHCGAAQEHVTDSVNAKHDKRENPDRNLEHKNRLQRGRLAPGGPSVSPPEHCPPLPLCDAVVRRQARFGADPVGSIARKG